jgi:IclR family acetate operon transcriptional repressor
MTTTKTTKGERAKPVLDGVERTVRILRAFEAEQELTLADVARAVELSEATTLRYLSSLTHFGLVHRTPASRYRLGWEVFRLGQLAVANRVPRDLILPVMERLHERFNETVNLALREGDDIVIVEVLQGTGGIRKVNDVGQHDPWHASALGKAFLSKMPSAERRALLERNDWSRFTPHTIVDIDALERDLDEAARQGYALDREEAEDDLTCVGAAVTAINGQPQFAISVSFLTHRLGSDDLAVAGETVAAAALELQQRLGHVAAR